MSNLQPVRGTYDIYSDEMLRHTQIVKVAQSIASLYGFQEIATPIIEFSGVFSRTLGDSSDVVTKEMYTFQDRGGEQLTLRPENTASIMRAFHSNGFQQHSPCRFFSHGPMFRYERPQKGRRRQFHQINAELIGICDPLADAEMIILGTHILEALGIRARTNLTLNTLGDTESRQVYRAHLVDFFIKYESSLSKESRERMVRNPLRILDSKNTLDREIVADAPEITKFLTYDSQCFFEAVQNYLTKVGVAYTLNSRLVRGLDYYCHTAFEFVTDDLGAQGTVMGGGRYDGLSEQMGSNPTPGVGWAAGIERIAMMINQPPTKSHKISLIPSNENAFDIAYVLAHQLRYSGFDIDLSYSGNKKKRMKRAGKLNAVAVIFIESNERASKNVVVRDMETGEQNEITLIDLKDYLTRYL